LLLQHVFKLQDPRIESLRKRFGGCPTAIVSAAITLAVKRYPTRYELFAAILAIENTFEIVGPAIVAYRFTGFENTLDRFGQIQKL